MATKKNPIFEYLNWFFKQYHQIQQTNAPQHTFRLVDIRSKRKGKHIVTVQVIGTQNIFSASPDEILNNDRIIEHFSSSDIRKITQYVYETKPHKCEILSQTVNHQNEILFKIKSNEDDLLEEKTASEISLNPELIDSLSSRDAHTVGYLTAHEMNNRVSN